MKVKEVRDILKITNRTISNYVKLGKIKVTKINDKHYIYDDNDIYLLLNKKLPNRINVTYSRVSLPKQKNDLINQSKRLYDYCQINNINISKQYEDIKSGMEFKNRNNFNKLIDDVLQSKINIIVIENKDRLCIFGFDLFESISNSFGTTIIVTTILDNPTYEQELTNDLISIIHHFSMKSYSNRRKLNKIKTEPQSKEPNDNE